MTDFASPRAYDLDFFTTAGLLAARPDGSVGGALGNQGSLGRVLVASTTYYMPMGSSDAPMVAQTQLCCAHFKWDAALIVTITLESCCFAQTIGNQRHGPVDVSDWDTAKGNWIQENPSTASISVTSTDASTGGATVTNATVVVAGGTAGGCTYHFGNTGSRRSRFKLVVGGTGGALRCGANAKSSGG